MNHQHPVDKQVLILYGPDQGKVVTVKELQAGLVYKVEFEDKRVAFYSEYSLSKPA